MKISAVIPHFWEARRPNLDKIVLSLRAEGVDEILIWNNENESLCVRGANVINAGKNYGPQARFLAGLLTTGTHVLFQDNDVAPTRGTVAKLAQYANDQHVLVAQGRLRGDGSYHSWKKVYSHDVDHLTRVDIALGRFDLMPMRVVGEIVSRMKFTEAEMDDLWSSAAMSAARISIFVAPRVQLYELGGQGVGACKTPGFYDKRVAAFEAALAHQDSRHE